MRASGKESTTGFDTLIYWPLKYMPNLQPRMKNAAGLTPGACHSYEAEFPVDRREVPHGFDSGFAASRCADSRRWQALL